MTDAARAMDAELVGCDGDATFEGVVLDSRRVGEGQLFFALEGEQTDGHRFVAQALRAGAAGAVVRRDAAFDDRAGCLLRVRDTFEALHDLVREVRTSTPRHLVAITGSAGKTTTKELLALMLGRRYRTAASPGNLNNLYGFPIALMGIDDDTEWMVAEMGMSTPGELGGVSRLGRPDIGIFTNVHHVHVEAFEDAPGQQGRAPEEMIADAKAELLEGLDPRGLVIVNAGNRHTVDIGRRHLARGGGRWIGFALDPETVVDESIPVPLTVRIHSSTDSGHRLTLGFGAEADGVDLFLPLPGTVNVENFLAAATCAVELGVPLRDIALAMADADLPDGRGRVREAGGAVLIDDSYNSNPSALEQAMRSALALRRRDGRLWAVLGEMKELGRRAPELHRASGELAGALGFERVVGVGEMARELLSGAGAAGAKVRWYPDAEAARAVAEDLRPGDVVLVKGSRSVGLETVVEALVSAAEAMGQD